MGKRKTEKTPPIVNLGRGRFGKIRAFDHNLMEYEEWLVINKIIMSLL